MEDIGYTLAALIWGCLILLAIMLVRVLVKRHADKHHPKPIVLGPKTTPNPFMAPTPAIEVRNVICNIRFPINR